MGAFSLSSSHMFTSFDMHVLPACMWNFLLQNLLIVLIPLIMFLIFWTDWSILMFPSIALMQVKPEVISWSPRIIVLHNFLSMEVRIYHRIIISFWWHSILHSPWERSIFFLIPLKLQIYLVINYIWYCMLWN